MGFGVVADFRPEYFGLVVKFVLASFAVEMSVVVFGQGDKIKVGGLDGGSHYCMYVVERR